MKIDEIKYIKGRKSVGIQIKDGRVYVRAPKDISDSKLNSVLKNKEGWIEKKLDEYNSAYTINRDIIEYRQFLYLGEKYDIINGHFSLSQNAQDISKEDCPAKKESKDVIPPKLKRIERDYRKRAAPFLSGSLQNISVRTGLQYNLLKITRSKAKWGSCNDKGVITLNWRLIMLPQSITEYVILHELCHLKNMDHSKEYWQTLAKYYNDVKGAKQYLKANNYIIKLF